MPVTINGTTGITFNNSTVQASAGQVLQVVQGTTTTATSTTSSSFVATNLTATITPRFSTSKVAVFVSGAADNNTTNTQCNINVYRNNATNLGGASGFTNIFSNSGRVIGSAAIHFIDSPSTTSATTYTVYINGSAATPVQFPQSGTATIILMEIAA